MRIEERRGGGGGGAKKRVWRSLCQISDWKGLNKTASKFDALVSKD